MEHVIQHRAAVSIKNNKHAAQSSSSSSSPSGVDSLSAPDIFWNKNAILPLSCCASGVSRASNRLPL